MERDEAFGRMESLVAQGRVAFIGRSVEEKMHPYGITEDDVLYCLANPVAFERVEAGQRPPVWWVVGVTMNGYALGVYVVVGVDVLEVGFT